MNKKIEKLQLRLLQDFGCDNEIICKGSIGIVVDVTELASDNPWYTVQFDDADIDGWPERFPAAGWPAACPIYTIQNNISDKIDFIVEPITEETKIRFENRKRWLTAIVILQNSWENAYKNNLLSKKKHHKVCDLVKLGVTHPMVKAYL